MRIRPRSLLKQLSQRTGTNWFRGRHLILVRERAGNQAGGDSGGRRDHEDLGVEYTSLVRRARPHLQ